MTTFSPAPGEEFADPTADFAFRSYFDASVRAGFTKEMLGRMQIAVRCNTRKGRLRSKPAFPFDFLSEITC